MGDQPAAVVPGCAAGNGTSGCRSLTTSISEIKCLFLGLLECFASMQCVTASVQMYENLEVKE